MSWFTHMLGMDKDPQAPIKSLMRSAPKTGNANIDANQQMKRELLGSFKKGGKVKKTGAYKLHKGEEVIPKKKVDMAKKMSSFESMNKERVRQGYKPKKDRATKGLYDFLDRFDK